LLRHKTMKIITQKPQSPQVDRGFFWNDITLQTFVLKLTDKEIRFEGKIFSPETIFDSNYYGNNIANLKLDVTNRQVAKHRATESHKTDSEARNSKLT